MINIASKYSKDQNYDFTGYLMYKDKTIAEIKDTTFIDALCYNIDRHTFNFGILRKDGEPIGLALNFDNNLALSGVLNDNALEKTWYSTSFTKNNYKPILEEYNYDIPKGDFEKIKCIINDTLNNFPTLKAEIGFNEIVFKIIKSNYEELLNVKLMNN